MAIKTIKFYDNVDISDGVSELFDSEAYSSIIGSDSFKAELVEPFLYADVLFTVEYDDEYTTDEEVWFSIEGEFGRPERA